MFRSLNQKIFFAVFLSYALFAGIGYWIKYTSVLPKFSELEFEFACRDMDRIITAIQNETKHLERICSEWSYWDDTVQFVQDLNQEFISKNLAVNTLEEDYVQYGVFYDKNLTPVYIASDWHMPVPSTFNHDLSLDIANLVRSTIDINDHTFSITSLIPTKIGTMLIVAQPIQPSEGNGLTYGLLVMGRLLADPLLSGLQEQTKIPFQIETVLKPSQTEKFQDGHYILMQDNYYLTIDNKDKLHVYSMLSNINGKPVCIIHFPFSRAIYKNGFTTLHYTMMWESFFAILILLALHYFMKRYVLSPLKALTHFVKRTKTNDTFEERIHIQSNDEINVLANAFNNLLAHLNAALQEIKESSEAKSKFLSQLSHELRTPMQAITGSAELLMYDKNDKITESQKQKVQRIINSSHHTLSLINDLLDLSKAESGAIELHLERFELLPIISDAINMVHTKCTDKNIQLHFLSEPCQDITVKADQVRLKQVLLNLLSNAVKYNRPNGSVTVDCIKRNQNQIQIDIKDTGIGIPIEKQSNVFQAFQRLHDSPQNIEGTGIGLTISKHLIEAMGGSIHFTSKENVGSVFSIRLNITNGN